MGTEEMEDAVRSLYEAYPYPAGTADAKTLPELGALLKLLAKEASLEMDGVRLLDVGTGSGNRLLGAARLFPEMKCTGVDFSAASIGLAQRLTAELRQETPDFDVDFVHGDILNAAFADGLGSGWDLVTCMGVLHHIPRVTFFIEYCHRCFDGIGGC